MTPSAFIFLYELQLFLTFRNRSVAVWNFRGELVTSFEDHLLWHPDCNTNNIYITSDQDLIISYCKADSNDSSSEENGTIFLVFFLAYLYIFYSSYNWNHCLLYFTIYLMFSSQTSLFVYVPILLPHRTILIRPLHDIMLCCDQIYGSLLFCSLW